MAPKSNNNKKTKETPANSSGKRAARVSLSPSTLGTKRKQEDDDGEPTRRVSQRTDEVVIKEEKATNQQEEEGNWKESLSKILQHDLWNTDTDVAEDAMNDLVGILYADNDNNKAIERQKHFFFLGGHGIVVGAMNAHPDLEYLQENGIAVLANAAHHNKETQDAVVAVKGFDAILTAMKKFHLDGDIQAKGMGALCNLLVCHEANADLFVTKHGGITFLLQQLESFPNNVELIEDACSSLQDISLYDKFRKSLVDAKAISIIGRAFDHYKDDNEHIKKYARGAIRNILDDDDD